MKAAASTAALCTIHDSMPTNKTTAEILH